MAGADNAAVSRKAREMEANALKKRYLKGLKQRKENGGRILIDGKETSERAWRKLFGVSEDGGFYMADFGGQPEKAAGEVRFERICVRDFFKLCKAQP